MIKLINPNTPISSEEKDFRRILAGQLARYPQMEVQDVYKLIYQASMGSEHAIKDFAFARTNLYRELKEIVEGPEEPIFDVISPDGQIARVNLRPYIANQGDIDKLLAAFTRTANEYKGSTIKLTRYRIFAERMAAEVPLGFSPNDIQTFFHQMGEKGFPSVHHSPSYNQAYHPAYRVVLHELMMDE